MQPQRRRGIPTELAVGRRSLDIEFRVRNPISPAYWGVGTTSPFVGLNMQSLMVRYEW
jgi:hypothetical protein